MWLSGSEAVECGLVNSIRGGMADQTVKDAVYMDTNGTDAYRYVAAIAKNIHAKLEARKMENEEKKEVVAEETTQVTAETNTAVNAEVKAEEEEEKTEAKAECGENEETKAEEEEKTEAEEEEKTEAEEEEKTEAKAEEDEEIKALRAENETLKAEVENLKAIVAKYNVSAKPEPVKETKSFLELMKEIPANLSQQEYAKRYSALKAEHKAEYEAFMNSRQSR
jgi:hypothetical protein